MNHYVLSFVFAITSFTASVIVAEQAPVDFQGTTSFYRDRDDKGDRLPESDRKYLPQPDVRVRAFRQLVVGTDVSRLNAGEAVYQIMVPEGAPFHVLFQDDKLVPELKTLTADRSKPQRVHVTLLTPRQFGEIFGPEELTNHLKRIMRILRRTDGIERREIQELEKRFKDQFGIDTSK